MGAHALPNPGLSTESDHEMIDVPQSIPLSWTKTRPSADRCRISIREMRYKNLEILSTKCTGNMWHSEQRGTGHCERNDRQSGNCPACHVLASDETDDHEAGALLASISFLRCDTFHILHTDPVFAFVNAFCSFPSNLAYANIKLCPLNTFSLAPRSLYVTGYWIVRVPFLSLFIRQ
jgi:hypothetical protein